METGILLLIILLAGNWIRLIASDIEARIRHKELLDRIKGPEAAQSINLDEFKVILNTVPKPPPDDARL